MLSITYLKAHNICLIIGNTKFDHGYVRICVCLFFVVYLLFRSSLNVYQKSLLIFFVKVQHIFCQFFPHVFNIADAIVNSFIFTALLKYNLYIITLIHFVQLPPNSSFTIFVTPKSSLQQLILNPTLWHQATTALLSVTICIALLILIQCNNAVFSHMDV